MLFEFLFGRALRRTLREELGHAFTNQGRTLIREVIRTVATPIESMTARLAGVERHQRKTIREVADAKAKLVLFAAEIARLRDIITSGQGTIPAEQMAALEAQIERVENLSIEIDTALPDLPEPGASPPEEGASPAEGASPVEAGQTGTESEAAASRGDVFP